MGIVLDSNIFIRAERKQLDLAALIGVRGEEPLFLSVITASELLHGVSRANTPDVRTRRSAFVEGILENFPILSIDLACARIHARLSADLAASGTLIGAHDLWIAASCISGGHLLITSNLREFNRIPGLLVEAW